MSPSQSPIRRRDFLQQGALGAAGLTLGALGAARAEEAPAPQMPHVAGEQRPNILLILTDQHSWDAISGHGMAEVHTPNIDRLLARGTSFLDSHSTCPVCSPARSSIFTGRMASETGVYTNDRPIHPSLPNMGQWLRQAGYDTYYCGKWHLTQGYPIQVEGFDTIPVGRAQGDLVDEAVSRSCEAFLHNRRSTTPFLFVAGLMQPHDICYWAIHNPELVPPTLRFESLREQLPSLPPNFHARPEAPELLEAMAYGGFNEEQWRYYLYIYHRQIEMMDADLGRMLDALEDSGHADNTLVLFTSDHGEGAARHQHVQKWYPYDESTRVPLIAALPGRGREDLRDAAHLTSGIDLMPTVCDYAGIAPPPGCQGRSLRPLIEGRNVEWREFIAVENHIIGRSIRTPDYKYVHYLADPVEQLFDMQADPWETENRYRDPALADRLEDHRRLLADWEKSLHRVAPTECVYPNPPWIQKFFDIWKQERGGWA